MTRGTSGICAFCYCPSNNLICFRITPKSTVRLCLFCLGAESLVRSLAEKRLVEKHLRYKQYLSKSYKKGGTDVVV